ncbi:hypothetical protein BU23DRAFT_559628 [Bimuria novae-zelandiae CBS 107.79]|uniref:Uncharacterized protein n=1 Tax=Bimuria novae-zelandiae CBS 107.79 TaxID=1447943 RepID=A0A6A5UPG1_9PLEO|nr:hypothetical protein BU23DRAFT_559628 [Bimuria novae-zelandiae CBS 107.79]
MPSSSGGSTLSSNTTSGSQIQPQATSAQAQLVATTTQTGPRPVTATAAPSSGLRESISSSVPIDAKPQVVLNGTVSQSPSTATNPH